MSCDGGNPPDLGRGLPDEDRVGVDAGRSLRPAYLHRFPWFGGDKVASGNGFSKPGIVVTIEAGRCCQGDCRHYGVLLKN
jgi:hypothetical protein